MQINSENPLTRIILGNLIKTVTETLKEKTPIMYTKTFFKNSFLKNNSLLRTSEEDTKNKVSC